VQDQDGQNNNSSGLNDLTQIENKTKKLLIISFRKALDNFKFIKIIQFSERKCVFTS
jgi:hypothetical protein